MLSAMHQNPRNVEQAASLLYQSKLAACSTSLSRRAWNLPRRRIARRPIKHQKRKQIRDLLRRQLPFDVFRHVRKWARRHLLDVAASDCLDLAPLSFEDDALGTVFHKQ